MKPLDITGQKFGRLTAVERREKWKSNFTWLFRCDCGSEVVRPSGWVRSGRTQSCGCLATDVHTRRLTTHGHKTNGKSTPTYNVWVSMNARCSDTNLKAYPRYGGRGIYVCERWRNSFENFLADMGERPPGHSIDRIDNDGPYVPENCRWATPQTQVRNRRLSLWTEFKGERLPLREVAQRAGVRYESLWARMDRTGQSAEDAVAALLASPHRSRAAQKSRARALPGGVRKRSRAGPPSTP